MLYALFTLRGTPDEQWLIGKKKKEDITIQDVSDTMNEKTGNLNIWACDVENFRLLEDKEEIKSIFKKIPNERKLFM